MQRGGRISRDGWATLVLWAPDCGDVVIDAVAAIGEALPATGVEAEREDDGAHWTARVRAPELELAYSWRVAARSRSAGRRWQVTVGDPYAREVRRDYRSLARLSHEDDAPAPFARPKLRDLVVYELHVYNFTAEDPRVRPEHRGTYAGVIDKLAYLEGLGVTAIELMPVFDYSDPWQVGVRWNYITPVHLCAPHRGYAADEANPRKELRALVDAAHARGMAVLLDTPFNHVSHRFAYAKIYDARYRHHARPDLANNPLLGDFGGTDPNPGSIPYRNHDWGACDLDWRKPAALDFARDVMRVWADELGVDGFRFDHTLGYYVWNDQTIGAGAVAAAARALSANPPYRIAEHFSSEENERAMLALSAFQSQWAKGFFYAAEEALRGGGLSHLAWRMDPRAQGFPDDKPPTVFLCSHDDERLVHRGGDPWWRMQPAIIALYTHPGIPLVYMGDEYAEDDRTRWEWGMPREVSPIDWELADAGRPLLRLHRALGLLRRRSPALRGPALTLITRDEAQGALVYARGEPEAEVIVAIVFGDRAARLPIPAAPGRWHELLEGGTAEARGGLLWAEREGGGEASAVTVPSWYGHVYCRQKLWTDEERAAIFADDPA